MGITPEEFNKNVEDMRVEMKHLKSEVRKAYNKLSKQQATEALIHEAVEEALKGVKVSASPKLKTKGKRSKIDFIYREFYETKTHQNQRATSN